MLKHEEMIENVHRRIAQYEEEQKMKHSVFKSIISAIKTDSSNEEIRTGKDGDMEIVTSAERVDNHRHTIRMISSMAAGAVLLASIGATGILLHRNRSDAPVMDDSASIIDHDTASEPAEIVESTPFSDLLDSEYELDFPNITFNSSMREGINALFGSVDSWKTVQNYNRLLHFQNGGTWSPFGNRITFSTDNHSLRIMPDDIIEYAVFDGSSWKKTFYQCDSMYLISGIAEIMEKEFSFQGFDLNSDLEDMIFGKLSEYYNASPDEIQKSVLRLCILGSDWTKTEKSGISNECRISRNGFRFSWKDAEYTCNGEYFLDDACYILSDADYQNYAADITISDANGVILNNSGADHELLEAFVYNELPSMLKPWDESGLSDDDSEIYTVDVLYSSGARELRSESFSIGSNGSVGRLDYMYDPAAIEMVPAGAMNYSIDYNAFRNKINALLAPDKNDKKDSGKTDEIQTTATTAAVATEAEETTENADTQPVETTVTPVPEHNDEPVPTAPEQILDSSGDTDDNDDQIDISLMEGILIKNKDYKIIASPKTHSKEAQEEFFNEKFMPMLTGYDPSMDGIDDEYLYTIIRTYKGSDDVLRYVGYYIYSGGHVLVYDYVMNNGEWWPDGTDGTGLDISGFKKIIDEYINDRK